jgi:hypothetical protein
MQQRLEENNMAFRLAIDDKVNVLVKGKIKGAVSGADRLYSFTILMDRIDQDQINTALGDGGLIADFLVPKAHGWDGQRLVLNEDGTPAAYSADAFHAMLKIPGMAVQVYRDYLRDVGVQEKN